MKPIEPRLPTEHDAAIARSTQPQNDPSTRPELTATGQPLQDAQIKLQEASVRPAQVPQDQNRAQADSQPGAVPDQPGALLSLLARLGLQRGSDGQLNVRDTVTLDRVPGIGTDPGPRLGEILPGLQVLPTQGPSPVYNEPNNPQALGAFSDALGRSIDDLIVQAGNQPTFVSALAADSLTATFMKLNIDNPLDTVAARQQLEEALSEMRMMAIKNIQKALLEADKAIKEAMADAMGGFMMAAILAAIIAAVIAAIIAGLMVAIIVAIVVMMVMMLVKQMVKGMIEKKAAEAKKMAEDKAAQAYQQLDHEIAQQRQEQLERIAEMSLVGPDGEPLTSEGMKAQLHPALVNALKKVTNILDTQGPEATAELGPQIIHEAMYDELVGMGLSHEQADGMAWAIAGETMQNLVDKVGRTEADPEGERADPEPVPGPGGGRHPGDTTGDVPGSDDPIALVEDDISSAPGRHPGEIQSALTALEETDSALTALMSSTLIDQVDGMLAGVLPAERLDRIGESLMTQGIAATLANEVLDEPSIAPSMMLALGAILSGSLPSDITDGKVPDDLDAKEVLGYISEAKDRALTALNSVGEESRRASAELHRPTLV